MAETIPRSFRDEDAGKGLGKFGIFFQGDAEDLPGTHLFGFGRMELVDIVTFLRKERESTGLRCVGHGELEETGVGFGADIQGRNPGGDFPTDPVEEALQVK